MNTGIQRSGATPRGASTTTEPAGKVKPGKLRSRKDLTGIMAAHNIPYVAQASGGYYMDLIRKAEKAFAIPGPKFLNVLQPCRLGWAYKQELTMEIARLAVQTCMWPVYEVENGKWKLTMKPKQKKPVVELLKLQDRFRHLFKPGNEQLLADIQKEIDENWQTLLERCGENQ
jgi:pyruvate ferredoxin oxidoreductase beta subunit